MCYHIKPVSKDKLQDAFDNLFSRPEPLDPKKHFVNGFQHPQIDIITNADPTAITSATWGLIPEYAANMEPKEFYKKTNTLNARIEELDQKKSYRDYTHNRCVIPVYSFKEWQHGAGNTKIPYEISMPDGRAFALAGIYSVIHGAPTVTIMMTEANELMSEIHNSALRMPVVLQGDEYKTWLNNDRVENYFDRTAVQLAAMNIDTPPAGQPLSLF